MRQFIVSTPSCARNSEAAPIETSVRIVLVVTVTYLEIKGGNLFSPTRHRGRLGGDVPQHAKVGHVEDSGIGGLVSEQTIDVHLCVYIMPRQYVAFLTVKPFSYRENHWLPRLETVLELSSCLCEAAQRAALLRRHLCCLLSVYVDKNEQDSSEGEPKMHRNP